jgi:hypothetical protein
MIADLVVKSNPSDIFPPSFVLFISKTWMVSLLNTITFRQCFFADEVKVFDSRWEPRDLNCSYLTDVIGNQSHLVDCHCYVVVSSNTLHINEEIDTSPSTREKFGWFRLNPCHVYLIIRQDVDRFVQNTWGLSKGKLEGGTAVGFPHGWSVCLLMNSIFV